MIALWCAAFGGVGALVMVICVIIRATKSWVGSADLVHVKCTRCRGGMQAMFSVHGRSLGWARIPDNLLLLHRRPDVDGGDKWGTPMANTRNCPCCTGLGIHITTSGKAKHWRCPEP